MAKKKEELDPETLALIHWCIEVEGFLVAGGATVEQAQEHIEEQVEWFTDQFYDGLTPDVTFLLDLRPAAASDRPAQPDRFEEEGEALQHAVAAAYEVLAERHSDRYVRIDAARPVEEVHRDVLARVQERLRATPR